MKSYIDIELETEKSQTERACRGGYEKRTAHIGKSGDIGAKPKGGCSYH